MLGHREQFRRHAKEVFTNVGARLDDAIFLILAVDDFTHAFDESAVDISALDKILSIDPDAQTATVEPGVTFKKLAADNGRFYPLPALASKFGG